MLSTTTMYTSSSAIVDTTIYAKYTEEQKLFENTKGFYIAEDEQVRYLFLWVESAQDVSA